MYNKFYTVQIPIIHLYTCIHTSNDVASKVLNTEEVTHEPMTHPTHLTFNAAKIVSYAKG